MQVEYKGGYAMVKVKDLPKTGTSEDMELSRKIVNAAIEGANNLQQRHEKLQASLGGPSGERILITS